MPVSRTILLQFQCSCDGQGEINQRLNDPSLCYSTEYPNQRCFPEDAVATQIVALVIGSLYLVGIPVFYYQLISKTVLIVLSTSRQYKLLGMEIHRLEALDLPKGPKRDRVRQDLAEYKRIQFKLSEQRTHQGQD